MNASILLVCAVIVSLASGVLMAYGLCLSLFTIFRTHARQVAGRRQPTAPAPLGIAGS